MRNETDELTPRDALLGGPGLDGYAWQADVYCVDCGREITRKVFEARSGAPVPFPEAGDSDTLPQPIFFGESDGAQHCADCGEYLYGDGEGDE